MEEEAVWNRWKEVATEGMRGGGAGIGVGKKKYNVMELDQKQI